jgi:hypothetical protein
VGIIAAGRACRVGLAYEREKKVVLRCGESKAGSVGRHCRVEIHSAFVTV